jgi:hypothetical protein
MPPVDLDRLQAEDAIRPVPYRFAEAIPVGYTTDNAGTWDDLPDGGRVWRLRIASSGAQSLNLGFTRFDLPEGASLWLYSEAQDQVEGPYTASDRTSDGQLWTPVILGDTLVVEVHVPSNAPGAASIELGFVNHGYRNFGDEEGVGKTHGACNYDVICAEGNPWRDQIRSVARYTRSGTFLCTGTLMNNTANDFTPYLLTANHCGITAGNAGTIVSYWNYQAPVCGQQNGGSLTQNLTGATLRASHATCEFALVELSAVPLFDVFYSGWDASGAVPQSGVGIHHPRGHVKSISLDDDPLTSYDIVTPPVPANCTGLTSVAHTHWRVGAWNKGTTEGGSSGSCIWDPADGRCVGYLSCGDAACNGANPNAGSDYYGKMSCAWAGGGTAATRLVDWLDPLATGNLLHDGLESPDPAPNKCASEKIKAAGKKAKCKSDLESNQASKGGTIDGAKVAKCESKLSSTFAKSEAKGGCTTTGDAAAIEAKVDAFVTDLDTELAVGTLPNKCQGEKIKAAGKKADCKLGLKSKQAKKGGTIDPAKVAKCESKLSAAFAKNEGKGGCNTTGDAAAIEAKVDAFVADVDTEIVGSANGAFLN